MRQVSLSFSLTLSLTVCTHVEFVPAQLQRQPSAAAAAAAGNLKPVFYLKDGGGGGGGERGGGERKRIYGSLLWIKTTEMGQGE